MEFIRICALLVVSRAIVNTLDAKYLSEIRAVPAGSPPEAYQRAAAAETTALSGYLVVADYVNGLLGGEHTVSLSETPWHADYFEHTEESAPWVIQTLEQLAPQHCKGCGVRHRFCFCF
jgi:hypothetical protein